MIIIQFDIIFETEHAMNVEQLYIREVINI